MDLVQMSWNSCRDYGFSPLDDFVEAAYSAVQKQDAGNRRL